MLHQSVMLLLLSAVLVWFGLPSTTDSSLPFWSYGFSFALCPMPTTILMLAPPVYNQPQHIQPAWLGWSPLSVWDQSNQAFHALTQARAFIPWLQFFAFGIWTPLCLIFVFRFGISMSLLSRTWSNKKQPWFRGLSAAKRCWLWYALLVHSDDYEARELVCSGNLMLDVIGSPPMGGNPTCWDGKRHCTSKTANHWSVMPTPSWVSLVGCLSCIVSESSGVSQCKVLIPFLSQLAVVNTCSCSGLLMMCTPWIWHQEGLTSSSIIFSRIPHWRPSPQLKAGNHPFASAEWWILVISVRLKGLVW